MALGSGAQVVAGAAMAFILEIIPRWGSKVPEALRPYIVLVLPILLAFGVKELPVYPDVIERIAPIYTTISLIVAAWLGTQLGYARAKAVGIRAEKV